jgi:hypothetical protein
MIEPEEKKEKRKGFFARTNNNGVPSLNEQNHYNPDTRDWEHRKYRIKDKF